ncbi:MAG: HAD family hydrolase [Candidatus Phosphoribacter sp.]|nr:HAD family phosphatase [Actinomycetales bacterium]
MAHPPRLNGAGMPRLVASDLDGTLLRSDGTVSERTRAAWRALDEHDIESVIVTARPPRWLHDLEDVVGPRGIAVCGNGAFIYRVATREVIAAHCFDPDTLAGLVGDVRAAVAGVMFAAEGPDGPVLERGFPDPRGEAAGSRRAQVASLAEAPVGKLLAIAPTTDPATFFDVVTEVIGARGVLAYSGAHGLAEINPPGVSKDRALADYCADLGIAAAAVWAFGDMPNDVTMLRWAGRGFAVANAHPTVLAIADEVCRGNDDDGVAHVLERLFGPV